MIMAASMGSSYMAQRQRRGAPALRLSDVVNCPPELYEIVPSVMIEGQPMVKFRSGVGEKGNCTARGEETVSVEGESASRLGDVTCTQN